MVFTNKNGMHVITSAMSSTMMSPEFCIHANAGYAQNRSTASMIVFIVFLGFVVSLFTTLHERIPDESIENVTSEERCKNGWNDP